MDVRKHTSELLGGERDEKADVDALIELFMDHIY